MDIKNDSEILYINNEQVAVEENGFRNNSGIKNDTNNIPSNNLLRVEGVTIKDQDDNILNNGKALNIWYEYDTTTRTVVQTWVDGKTWSNHTKSVGTDIVIYYRCPMRNNADGWGGGYLDIQYSTDGGSVYTSLGSAGYDGGVMYSGADAIGNIAGSSWLDLQAIRDAEQIRFRFSHYSYADTTTINGSHDITTGAMGCFWTNLTIQEIGI